MPFRKCSFCSNNNKNSENVRFFKTTKCILDYLGLPEDYGMFICCEHFQGTDITNNKLAPGSISYFLHKKSTMEHDHGCYAAGILFGMCLRKYTDHM